MKIERQGPSLPAERPLAGTTRQPVERVLAEGEPRREDRVEISAVGRERSSQGDTQAGSAVTPVPATTSDRLDVIRARIGAGFYESPDVIQAVARHIVARGDHRS